MMPPSIFPFNPICGAKDKMTVSGVASVGAEAFAQLLFQGKHFVAQLGCG